MTKLEIIKNMTELNPQNGDAWYLLGLEYLEISELNEALLAFSEALKFSCDSQKEKIIAELAKIASIQRSNINIEGEDKIVSTPNDCSDAEDLNDVNNELERDDEFDTSSDVSQGKLKVIIGGQNSNYVNIDFEENQEVSFKDIGGLDSLKDTITMRIIKPFSNPGLFQKYRKKIGGGILLYGPPGCGKTFIARATAGECKAKFIPVHITDILNPYLGVSSQNLRDIFLKARAHKPSVMFFDEIDTIGFNRAKLSSETMRPVIDQLLSEIEGIDSNTDKMLILAATNMPWDVDPALKRPGRFDKSVFVPPPDEEAREIIFELKMNDRPVGKVDYKLLAKKTELYSGADIESIVETAIEDVISEIMRTGVERTIEMNDLLRAIENSKPSTIEWLKTVKNYVKYANQSGYYDEVEKYINKYRKLI